MNIPTSNETANVTQTANHKLRPNTGTAQKSDAGAPKTVIESPHLEVAPCQFVGQLRCRVDESPVAQQRPDLLFPAE
ncbi:MAG TPA: hypothetical protein VN857_16505 [Chthoniobacterales bacterium]|nr:hypothetical protein [Chthoniobacterales bacterium]